MAENQYDEDCENVSNSLGGDVGCFWLILAVVICVTVYKTLEMLVDAGVLK